MSSRMDNSVRTRICNDNQQAGDVLELGLNESNDGEVHVIGRRRVRGQTYMPNIWAKYDGDRISVSFNENGQPVDKKTTSKLSHSIRSLVRSGKYYPLHKPWPKVDIVKKQTLLDILNDRFDLPPCSNDWILNYFENKVKSWRARVKKDYYGPSLPFQDQINSKPKRVRVGDWNKLVKSWNKENSKKVAEKAKANGEKKKMVQVTAKKRYARVREEIEECLTGNKLTRKEVFRACFSKHT